MHKIAGRKIRKTIWVAIPGFEQLYEISEYGQVRSLITNSARRNKTLNQNIQLYPTVTLYHLPNTCINTVLRSVNFKVYRNCKGHKYRIHTLMMLSFVGPKPDNQEVRHLDDNKLNNNISNLVYGTSKQNSIDSVVNKTNYQSNKTHCPEGHPYDDKNTRWVKTAGRRPSRQCIACYPKAGRKKIRSEGTKTDRARN